MKKEKIECYIKKLSNIARKAVECNDVEKACMIIKISAEIQNNWNQRYTDDDLERCIENLSNQRKSALNSFKAKKNVIVFYDGFGLDTRGLALIYIKALCDLGYSVIYAVPENARGKQPEIQKATNGGEITFCYLQNSSGDKLIDEILQTVLKYQPQDAFFYTFPADVEACVAFGAMAGKVRRYQINLTDHAFWLGKNAFDFCIENREYGACVSHEYRGIPAEKIKMLQFYPYFDRSVPFAGFPFESTGHPVMFSGGSLYKTVDDKQTYYKLVEEIMQRHKDLFFVYAGYGDRSGLEKLQSKYPDRVFILDERKDLYALMQHCTLYLNTYPLGGALMVQYAASAGLLPLSLLHYIECSFEGYLLEHKDMQLEFFEKEGLLNKVDKLLTDDNYRHQAENKIKDKVITEDMFQQELSNLLVKGNNEFSFKLHHIDTTKFRNLYMDRFTYDEIASAIIKTKTISIWWHFPDLFFYRKFGRMFMRLFNKKV